MVRAVVQEKFPQLVSLCQAAVNAMQQGPNVTWSEIKDEVLRSKPPNSASLPLVSVFVRRFPDDHAGSCDMFCLTKNMSTGMVSC